jgi:hypothetical protein
MIVLDISITITAIPRYTACPGLLRGGLAWVQTAYTLTFGGLGAARRPRRRHPRSAPHVHRWRRAFHPRVAVWSAPPSRRSGWSRRAPCRAPGAAVRRRRCCRCCRPRARPGPNAPVPSPTTAPSPASAPASGFSSAGVVTDRPDLLARRVLCQRPARRRHEARRRTVPSRDRAARRQARHRRRGRLDARDGRLGLRSGLRATGGWSIAEHMRAEYRGDVHAAPGHNLLRCASVD